MPREQSQDDPQKIRNPGTFSADDDEAQEADITHAGAQGEDESADVDTTDEDEGEEANDEEQPLP
jgi:hypothetical protein